MMKLSTKALRSYGPTRAAVLAAALVSPMAAMPADARGDPATGRARDGTDPVMRQRELQAVGVSPEQRSQIQAIMKQARADVQQQREAVVELRRQRARVLAAPTVDGAAAESARQRLVMQMEGIGQRVLLARLQVAALLTPEQRHKLLALDEQRRAQRSARWPAPKA